MNKSDFEFISDRDITVDENFASQGYWKGVAVHFFRNKFAVTGVILVSVIILFAVFAPVVSSYTYEEIVSVTDSSGKEFIAKSLSPQFGQSDSQNFFADKKIIRHEFLNCSPVRIHFGKPFDKRRARLKFFGTAQKIFVLARKFRVNFFTILVNQRRTDDEHGTICAGNRHG